MFPPAQAHTPADTEKPGTPWGPVFIVENPKHHLQTQQAVERGHWQAPREWPVVVRKQQERVKPASNERKTQGFRARGCRWVVGLGVGGAGSLGLKATGLETCFELN